MSELVDFFNLEAEVLTALAHPSRLEILELLRENESCVCHIQSVLDQRQAFVSQHLGILHRAGLVTKRKVGTRVYYRASDPKIFEIIDNLKLFMMAQKRWQVKVPLGSISIPLRKPCSCPVCTPSQA